MVEFVSDFLDRNIFVFRDDVCFFISQLGEIVDIFLVLCYCKDCGVFIVGVINIVGSFIFCEIDCGVYINVGLEIGVVSIKVYISQFIFLVMFGLMMFED